MEQNNLNSNLGLNDEINFKEIFFILWDKKYFIALFTSIIAIFSVFYALSLPNIYTSSALLAPSSEDESSSSRLGLYSAVGSIAGINLSNQNVSKSKEAVARIKSFEFFSKHFLPNIKLENLLAYKEWIPNNNISLYNEDTFNKESRKWIRQASYPKTVIPSDQEAYKVYKNILKINEDKKTSFVSLAIKHKSPFIAKKWLDIIIENINESMREESKKIAQNAINFLSESAGSTNIQSLKDANSILLESQMQTLMLASTYNDYVFKVIDSPIAPELKSEPSRAFICIIGTLFGGILSLFIVFIYHLWNVYRNKI